MSASHHDPNRYVYAQEAALLRDAISIHEHDYQVQRRRTEDARLVLAQAESSLREAEAFFATAQALFDSSKSRENALITEMHVKRGLMHPVRKVPHDIWRMIFLETQSKILAGNGCVPAPGERVRQAQDLAITLVLVSNKWKEAAQGVPQLWRFIHANVTNDLSVDKLAMGTARLERLRRRYSLYEPILHFDVYVNLGPGVARDIRFDEYFRQLFFIVQHSKAFEMAAFDGLEDYCDSYLSYWFHVEAIFLESLSLTADSMTRRPPKLPPVLERFSRTNYKKLFPKCPRLRSIELGNFPLELYAKSSCAPDALGIKHVDVWWADEVPGQRMLSTLKFFPLTLSLEFGAGYASGDGPGPITLQHSALRCLKLKLSEHLEPDFATGLTLPNLERIRFDGSDTLVHRGFGDGMASFLNRVCPNVSSVTVDCYEVESSMTRTLQELPRLRSLTVWGAAVTDDALFAPYSQNGALTFPVLEELIIDSTHCARGFTGRPLMAFIRTRFKKGTDSESNSLASALRAAAPQLKRVYISWEDEQFSEPVNDDLIEDWDAQYMEVVGDQDMRRVFSPTDELDQLEREFM